MARPYKPVDLTRLKTYSIDARAHRADAEHGARLPAGPVSFRDWWDSLPDYLGAVSLRAIVSAIVEARRADRPVVFALGAHVVKVGCSPIICDLLRRKIVTAIAMNGATAIHDLELATQGQTSEEVADTITDGRFGMVRETPALFAEAMALSPDPNAGLGAALGAFLNRSKPPHRELSILAAAHEVGAPVSVHVAIGTDTIHMHAQVAESALYAKSAMDFRLICDVIADLAPAAVGGPSGVWCNVGSAVLLPEVFLKGVAVARNLGARLDEIVTANFDMIRHYRPSENVIGRPVRKGRGHHVTGHHEIMLPLLRQALLESI